MNKKILDILNQKEYIKKIVKKNKRYNSYLDLIIISSIYNNIDLKEEKIEEINSWITEDTNDRSIDVVGIIKENDYSKTIYLIQHTKSKDKINLKIISSFEQMDDFIDNLNKDEFLNSLKNKKLIEVAKKIRGYVKEDKNVRFKKVFIADIERSQDIKQITWDKIKNNENRDRKIILSKKLNYYCVTKFIKCLPIKEFKTKKPAMFVYANQIKFSNKDCNCVKFGTINAGSLVHNLNKSGKSIFNDNVRFYLGKGNAVNNEMRRTLEEDKSFIDFTKFNNGVTIVYTKEDYNAVKKHYTYYDSQIINGAQTVNTLSKLNITNSELEQIWVPIKLIKEDDKEKIKLISKYSNSQSSINERDLYSNSEEQKMLQEFFFERGILLNIKRNEFNENVYFKKFLSISNIAVAQSCMATFLQEPQKAKNKKSDIFRDDNLYKQIFKVTGYKNILFKSFLINQCVEKHISELKNEVKWFNYAIEYIIYKRLEEISCLEKEIKGFKKALKNININFKVLFDLMKIYLISVDKDESGDEKDLRLLSISSKLKDNLDNFYDEKSGNFLNR